MYYPISEANMLMSAMWEVNKIRKHRKNLSPVLKTKFYSGTT
jgi:hypothetical protein